MAVVLRAWRAPVLQPGVRGVRLLCAGGGRLCPVQAGSGRHLPDIFLRLRGGLPARQLSQSVGDRKQNGDCSPADGGGDKPSKTQQLKRVFKEYGAVAVTFHVAISLTSLGFFYLLVSSGLDVSALLLRVGFSEAVVQSRLAAGTSTFVLAYAIHKLFAPVRISVTVVSVPFLVRYLRRVGIFKPPSPPPS
ncbi:protein FAM210B, mitochondrial [Gastrophryne carolinensis]